MNEPCRALMGYVPGRYVESVPQRAPRSKRECRWCGATMPAGARNSGCSAECSTAIIRAKCGKQR